MQLLLAGAAITFLLLLAIPYTVRIDVAPSGAEVRAGVLGFSWRVRGTRGQRSAELAPARRRERRASKRPIMPWRKLRAAFGSTELWVSLGELGLRMLRHLRPQKLRARLRFGLGDPCETGQLWGALCPLLVNLAEVGEEVWVEPDFGDATFQLAFSAEIRVVPGVLLLLVAGYLLSLPPWRAVYRALHA